MDYARQDAVSPKPTRYLTSHTPVPRTKLPPMDTQPEAVGMPREDDLAALMMRAAKGERVAVAKRDGTSHQPRAPRGEDIEAKRRAEMGEAENQRVVQFVRDNPGCVLAHVKAFNGKTQQATRNQLYKLTSRGLITARRPNNNSATTYRVKE